MSASLSSISVNSTDNKTLESKKEFYDSDPKINDTHVPSTLPTTDLEKGKPDPKSEDPYLAKWAENDPENPYNWSIALRSWMTFQLGMLALVGSLASSIIAPAEGQIGQDLNLSTEILILTVSLYVLGFIFGPCVWAPVSEIWGRRWSLLPPMIGLCLFSIGSATSKTPAALFVTRFFAGFFGSAPVSNVTAAIGDIWMPRVRGTAMGLYAVCVIGGQTMGPVIGSAITVTKGMGWRWTQ
jgi:predicted MFS family arabinose efflux permease